MMANLCARKSEVCCGRPRGYVIIHLAPQVNPREDAMLLLGRTRQRTCQGMTRRAFLQIGGSAVLGLSLGDLLQIRATTGSMPTGSARAVIFLWLWGGPAQLDTWDPKPNAAIEYRGPFASIQTRLPGVRLGELFPQVAGLTDRIAILRSLHTQSNDHGVAGTAGLTGSV